MLGWIKKRCKRRSLQPPSIQQLDQRETTLDISEQHPYFSLIEQDDGDYEEFEVGMSVDNQDISYRNLPTVPQRGTPKYENVPDYENVTPARKSDTICPMCRSPVQHNDPCACTNVYEEPQITPMMSSDDYAVPSDWSTSPDYVTQTKSLTEPQQLCVISEVLDVAYEIATCPFKVPKPKRKPVMRSYSDASSRPLPKLPYQTHTLPRKRVNSMSGDESSGYYESIGSDSGSSQYSQGYSDIGGSSQCYTDASDGFHEMSYNDDFDYEEFNFAVQTTPQCRRYSLGSATPTRVPVSLRKKDKTHSHAENIDKLITKSESTRRGPLFRSIRVRSLFKPK